MRTLYLLRHGLTEANERRLYCGRTDLPGGNEEQMEDSLRRLMPMVRSIPMHAGH